MRTIDKRLSVKVDIINKGQYLKRDIESKGNNLVTQKNLIQRHFM